MKKGKEKKEEWEKRFDKLWEEHFTWNYYDEEHVKPSFKKFVRKVVAQERKKAREEGRRKGYVEGRMEMFKELVGSREK